MAASDIPQEQLENQRKAFDLADGWAKLLSGFATGTIILSATFIKDVFPDDQPLQQKGFLFLSWAILGFSAFFGILVLSGLTANLVRSDSARGFDLYAGSIRIPALLQVATLVAGVAAFAFFVSKNL